MLGLLNDYRKAKAMPIPLLVSRDGLVETTMKKTDIMVIQR